MTSTFAANNPLSEDDLQRQVAAYLTSTLPDKCVFHHSPNEGVRRIAFKMRLKSMGTRYGWPDLEIFAAGSATHSGKPTAFFIELKTKKGRMNGNQDQIRDEIIAAEFNWVLCRSLDDVKEYIQRVIKMRDIA